MRKHQYQKIDQQKRDPQNTFKFNLSYINPPKVTSTREVGKRKIIDEIWLYVFRMESTNPIIYIIDDDDVDLGFTDFSLLPFAHISQ